MTWDDVIARRHDETILCANNQIYNARMHYMEKQFYIYILSSNNNSVLYTGVTSDLIRRVYEHKNKLCPGFTGKYNVNKLVYYEVYFDPVSAIEREKQLKGGSRKKKINLFEAENRKWDDLYYGLL